MKLMKLKIEFLLALGALTLLAGCKVDVVGKGTWVDLETGRTHAVNARVYSKNINQHCGTTLSFYVPQGRSEIIKLDSISINENGSNSIDTSREECNQGMKVYVIASTHDRVIGREWVSRPIDCPAKDHLEVGLRRPQYVKVQVETVVTTIDGRFIDKASGKAVSTFSATSEPRLEEASTGRPNCRQAF